MPQAAPGDPSPAAGCPAPCKSMSLGGGDNSPPEQLLHGSEMHKAEAPHRTTERNRRRAIN